MGYQQIILQGGCTRDAEVRQVGQSQVAKIGMAVSEKFRKADGTVGENTEFFDVEIWDKAGIYPYLVKGQQLLVVGQVKTEKWQDQSGQNRESKKVRAQVVQLVGSKPQTAQPQTAPVAPPQRPRPQAPVPPAPQYQAPPVQPQYPVNNDPNDLPF